MKKIDEETLYEIYSLCNLIVNTIEPRTEKDIKRIESLALWIGHHPLIINGDMYAKNNN